MQNQPYNFNLYAENSVSAIKAIGAGSAGSRVAAKMQSLHPNMLQVMFCKPEQTQITAVPNTGELLLVSQGSNQTGNSISSGTCLLPEEKALIMNFLGSDTRLLLVFACLGGQTGSNLAPEIVRAATELGIVTLVLVTTPFRFEGILRAEKADNALNVLKDACSNVLVIDNNTLKDRFGVIPVKRAFEVSDSFICETASAFLDPVVSLSGVVNIDLNDLNSFLKTSGSLAVATAFAHSEELVPETAIDIALAIKAQGYNLKEAHSILVILTCNEFELSMETFTGFLNGLSSLSGESTHIKFSYGPDVLQEPGFKITVLAKIPVLQPY